jgi:SulP family sulfate permease
MPFDPATAANSPAAPETLAAAGTSPGVRERLKWLWRYVPALDSLRTYTPAILGADILAGLTVATVAVPQAMAYALLAGLPPEYGLYTAVVMTAVGALFDSSRQLINGPTNAISIALLSALAVLPESDRVAAAVAFAFLVGAVQLNISLLRLGDLTRYVSHAVIVGFTLGAGVLLVLDQLKNLLGLAPGDGKPGDHFLTRFWLSLTAGVWNGPTVLIGLGTIVLVASVRRLNHWLLRQGLRVPIPQHLVAVIVMTVLVATFDLDQQGVKVVGNVPASLPHFRLPDLRWDQGRMLVGNAFAVAVLGLLEALAMAKAIAVHTGQKLDVNQQCLSEGLANLAGSFFQCMPGSGSLTRSTVNRLAGAVSQWSGIFSALAVAVTIVLFAPYAARIPRAALAGLLMLAAFRMVDLKQLHFHMRATRFDALIVLATALAAVLVSVEFCILIGVFLSFVLYIPRAAQVQLAEWTLDPAGHLREREAGDPRCGRMLVYSLEGELFFGAAPEMERYLSGIERNVREDTRVVVLVLKRARNPDAAFLALLGDFHARLESRGVVLILCGVRADLARGLRGSGLDVHIGPGQIIPLHARLDSSTRQAIARAYEVLGEDLCQVCPRRKGVSPDPDPGWYTI